MQLAMDIKDEITEAYGENYSAQPSILSVGGHKARWSSDRFETSKQKIDFRSGHASYPLSPKRAQTTVSVRSSSGSGGLVPSHFSSTNQSSAKSSVASSSCRIWQLPYAKFPKRKEEGRCFRGGLKVGPLHKCPQRQLQVLILAKEPKGKEEGEFVLVEAKRKRSWAIVKCWIQGKKNRS